MFQKIANFLSIISFLLITSIIGGGYFGYKYITSESFKSKIISELMPKVDLPASPGGDGFSLPTPK